MNLVSLNDVHLSTNVQSTTSTDSYCICWKKQEEHDKGLFIHGSGTSWCGNQMWKLAKTISLQSKCNQMWYFYVWKVMLMLMPSCLLGESLTCHFSCPTELSFVHSMRLVWKSNEFSKNITTLFYSTCKHMLGKRLLQPYRLLIIIRMFFFLLFSIATYYTKCTTRTRNGWTKKYGKTERSITYRNVQNVLNIQSIRMKNTTRYASSSCAPCRYSTAWSANKSNRKRSLLLAFKCIDVYVTCGLFRFLNAWYDRVSFTRETSTMHDYLS